MTWTCNHICMLAHNSITALQGQRLDPPFHSLAAAASSGSLPSLRPVPQPPAPAPRSLPRLPCRSPFPSPPTAPSFSARHGGFPPGWTHWYAEMTPLSDPDSAAGTPELGLCWNPPAHVREWLPGPTRGLGESKFAGQSGITRYLHALYTPVAGSPKAIARWKAIYGTNRWLESCSRRILRAILGPKR
jgi:hypothetical protein